MSIWGPLAERFESSKPQRKMLALDGGGIRGISTLEILSALERQLAQRLGRGADFRLCEYFEYVGGTSTGAIIATGTARGMSVAGAGVSDTGTYYFGMK
jgi:patatin-like phospholipase/acyl hydrolase